MARRARESDTEEVHTATKSSKKSQENDASSARKPYFIELIFVILLTYLHYEQATTKLYGSNVSHLTFFTHYFLISQFLSP